MRKRKKTVNYIHFIGPAVAIVWHRRVISSTVVSTRNTAAKATPTSYSATAAIVTVCIVASRWNIDGLR